MTTIPPRHYTTGFKAVRDLLDINRYVLCQLTVPTNLIRSNPALPDWRTADAVFVHSVDGCLKGLTAGVSIYNPMTLYIPGQWLLDPLGIHFFLSRPEAEALVRKLNEENSPPTSETP